MNSGAMNKMPVPAYMMIRQYAIDLVMRSPEREERILSERELCKTFEVTRPTVRKALKDLIEDGFLLIRPGLGTFTNPKRALSSLNAIHALSAGIIVGDGKHVSYTSFFNDIILGALNYITAQGGSFRMINIMHKGIKAVENISLLNVEGIIWINPPEDMLDIINGLDQRGIPVVIVNRFNKCNASAHIGIDYECEGYIVAKQFIEKGHKNILFAMNMNLHADIERLNGFNKAFDEAGLKYNKDFLLETEKDINLKLQKIIDENLDEITAIYALKYEMFKLLDAFTALKTELGKDYMIIALEYIMRLKPEINCLKAVEPLEEAGFIAAENLAGKIKGTLLKKAENRLKPKIVENTIKQSISGDKNA